MLEILGLLVTGGLAGWVAGTLMRGSGYGLVVNIVLGIIGGILGGKLFALFGIPVQGWLMELGMAVVGALALLAMVGLVRRAV